MVSIIVPVYNVEQYLDKCILSLIEQSFRQIEIILVDDGSTDESSSICDKYASLDSRIKVIHQQNHGSTNARNNGIQIATGEYLTFVDSDDWIEKEMLFCLLSQITDNLAEIAISARYIDNADCSIKEQICIPSGIYKKNDNAQVLIKNLIYSEEGEKPGISPHLHGKLFRREIVIQHQKAIDENTKYGEDDICVYGCLLDASCVAVIDESYYHYRVHTGSISHSSDDGYYGKIDLYYKQMKACFENTMYFDILFPKLKRHMFEMVLNGVNELFGFEYGEVVSQYIPICNRLMHNGVRKLALYGAGSVGKSFYSFFNNSRIVEIVVWVDRKYDEFDKQYLHVKSPKCLNDEEFDAIMIAVENPELANQIRKQLILQGIAEDKILYERPYNILKIF